jgi:hypothetical protein
MADPIELKPMPIASVIYVVTFEDGAPTVQARIHTDTAGRARFDGDAAKAHLLLNDAQDVISKRLAKTLTEQVTRTLQEKRLLNTELHPPTL